MNKKLKNQSIYALIIVCCLFLIVLVVGKFVDNENRKIINSESIDVLYKDSNNITIQNKIPVSDALGKTFDGKGSENGIQGYINFSIENTYDNDIKYNIYVKDVTAGNKIDSHYIKYYLTDDKDNPLEGFEKNILPTFYKLSVYDNDSEFRVLYTGNLKSGEKKNIILRSWLSDLYISDDKTESFSVDISVGNA